ncbi:MAG: hypothetical protein K2W94_06170, partial [Alphaproteobacteria bacterium]|nr:hypothetical protein [Alphaproteobacteria bacterium]
INGETMVVSGYPPLTVSYKKLLKKIGHIFSDPLLYQSDSAFKNAYFFRLTQNPYKSMPQLS